MKLFRWKYVAILLALIVFGPFIWSRLASTARRIRIRQSSNPSRRAVEHNQLKIACYNIAHGRGLAEDNWTDESPAERLLRLDDIAALLKEIDADVVALNEVDFSSSWSHQINQAEYLAKKAGYDYWCEERNLDFRILHRTWKFGNAVLSRHPIVEAKEVSLPGFQTSETWMAGKKRGLLCDIEVETDSESTRIRFVSAHLSHRSEDVRVASAKLLCDLARSSSDPFIVAGDLNSTPPDFEFSAASSAGENTISVFDQSGLFQRFPNSMPASEGLTFRTDEPKLLIDWLLIPSESSFIDYEVITSPLSDHRPVSALIKMGKD